MISFKSVRFLSWSAFRWLFSFYILSLLITGSVLRVFIYKSINLEQPGSRDFLGRLDEFLVYSFWSLGFVAFLFSILFAWLFFSPLGVLIAKAKSIRRGSFSKKDSAVIKESRGEWYQLDLALNKISKDLKQRKADVAKERSELEAVITAANDAILAVDREMSIRYYNAPMAHMFDQKDEGHWGKKLKEVIRNQTVLEAFSNALQNQTPQFIQVSQELAVDSNVHYFQVSVSPFFDEKKSKTRGAVAIFHDITEHKKIEKIRVDFVANASHELKTPLTSIQGFLSVIRDSCVDKKELQESFDIVENNLERLNRLVVDLLELSKIESLENVKREDLNIKDMTETILSDLGQEIRAKGHTISCEYLIEITKTSKELVEHIMINLIENAIKYCPPGSQIKIKWLHDHGFTLLKVKDNGPGIESYHQRRIFERFYRIREGGDPSIGGTGLGLSIVRNSAQRLGGHVDVKSAPGLGSEFICYLPD